ncbi:MAG: hypothetical protein MK240_06135, partial [Opitutales bacterium]|nr:hypothetical protein [Opitutales bacterium]
MRLGPLSDRNVGAAVDGYQINSDPRMLLSIGYWKLGCSLMKVRTLEEALEYVKSVGVCTLFSGKAKGVPALRDDVDLPKKGGGRTKWGAKAEAIWAWKNELPEVYPDEIYYGKILGGHAALMTIDYLVESYYAKAHKPVEACSE